MAKWKVWLHLEYLEDEEGEEAYVNGDEIMLPLPVGEYNSSEEACLFMEQLHALYYQDNFKYKQP